MTRRGPRRRRRERRRAVRGDRARRLAVPAAPRRARRAGVRLVLQRRREPDAVVHPALRSGSSRTTPKLDDGVPPRVARGLRAPSTASFADGGARRARARRPTRPSSSTTTTSTSRRASCARRGPTRRSMHFVHIPWPQPDYWHVLPARCAARDPRRAARERRRRLPHGRAGGATSCTAARTSSARVPTSSAAPSSTRPHDAVTRRPISVDPRSSTSWRRARRCSRPSGELESRAPGEARPARRPHRSVEEHRARLPRVRALPRRASRRCTAASGCSRCWIRRGRTSPSTPSTSVRSSARRGASTTASQRAAGCRSTCGSSDNFAAVGRRVQAVRRAARERDLRRAEPRREGGAARERARRCARPLRERRRARRARRLGADRQPVRRRGPGRGDPPRRSRWTPTERRRRIEAIRARVREHDVGGVASTSRARRALVPELGSAPVSELSHVDRVRRRFAWSTSAASRCRVAARSRAPTVRMAAETARRLRELPKGDALATAQLAGIMAAKRTSELIPLCHPLPLSHVDVSLEVGDDAREITAVRRDDRADRRRDGGADGGRPSLRSRSTTWRRRSTRRCRSTDVHAGGEDEGASVKAAVLTVSDGVLAGDARGHERRRARGAARGRRVRGRAARRCRTSATQIAAAIARARRGGAARADDRRHRRRSARRHAGGDARRCSTARRPGSPRRSAPTRSRRRRTRCSRAALAGTRGADARRQPPGLARRLPRRVRGDQAGARRTRCELLPDETTEHAADVSSRSSCRALRALVKIEHTVFALPFAYVGALLAVDAVPSRARPLLDHARDGRRPLARDGAQPADRRGARRAQPAHGDARAAGGAALARAGDRLLRRSRSLVFLVAVWQLDPIVRWLWPIPVAGVRRLPVPQALHLAGAPLARRRRRARAGRRVGRAHRDVRRGRRGRSAPPSRAGSRASTSSTALLRPRRRPAGGAALVGDALRRARRLRGSAGAARADGRVPRRRGARPRRRRLLLAGRLVVAALLVYEHSLVRPDDLRRLDAAFFTVNGVISVLFAVFVLLDVL